MNPKEYIRKVIIILFVVVIVISFGMRSLFQKVADVIVSSVDTASHVVSVNRNGIRIADFIKIDGEGISIGDDRIEYDDYSEKISDFIKGNKSDEDEVTIDSKEISSDMSGSLSGTIDDTANFVQNRYTFDATQCTSLDISVSDCDIIITSGQNEAIAVDVLESEVFRYDFSVSSHTLKIRENQKKSDEKALNIFGYRLSLGKTEKDTTYTGLAMIVYLPEDFDGNITVVSDNGDMKAANLDLDGQFNVALKSGRIELSEISASDINVETSSSPMTLNKLSATDMTVATSDGRITMTDLTVKRLKASTSSASIDLTRLFAEKSELVTSDGDISGTMYGSESVYAITTTTDRTASPKSRKNDRSQYKLTAQTSGGDINIRFIED